MKPAGIGNAAMERALFDGFRAGRREALEAVYWRHVGQVELLVRSGLQRSGLFSAANFADVVQDVFEKAFSPKARAAYDGERDYGPFLGRLARNAVVDWLRRNGRDPLGLLDVDRLGEEQAPTDDVESGPFPSDLVALTQRFVSSLDTELRAVHERRFLAAESQEAAARALGISRQTLRTLERRLLDGLAREIQKAEREERRASFPQPEHVARTVLLGAAPSARGRE